MSRSSSLYRISWLSSAGSEHTFESDPYDAITVARANNGTITYGGEDYTADKLTCMLEDENDSHYVVGISAEDGSLEIFEEDMT